MVCIFRGFNFMYACVKKFDRTDGTLSFSLFLLCLPPAIVFLSFIIRDG